MDTITNKTIAHYQQIPYHIPDASWYENLVNI